LRIVILILLLLAGPARLCGQAWERLGPEGGMVLSLGVGAAGTIYLGTSDGHIFASEDRGARWELRGRVGTRSDAVIAALTADPRLAGRVFAAAWFREAGTGGGVFRSDDGGRTWQPSGLQVEAVRALEFSASQPETLVAGTRSGVFRSRDAGKTWERISPPDDPELRNVDSVAVDPAQPDLIYAGTYHLPWKTVDGGKTWKSIAAGLIDDSDVMSLRVDESNPKRVYLSACSGIYRSDNRGDSWTKLQGIPYAARRTQAIEQDPANPLKLYAATTEGLWVTRDAGESWERTTPKDWVVNGVAALPQRGNETARILIGTEAQGVLASEDSGKNFTGANRGFKHQVVKLLMSDARDPMHLLMLLERNGVEVEESRDGGKSWSQLPSAPATGAGSGVSAERIERVYSSPWGWLAKLADGTLWKYNEQGKIWERWKASYPLPARQGVKRAAAPGLIVKPLEVPSAALGFSAKSAFLPAAEGVLRCDTAGKCELLSAFLRVSRPSALWVSSDGNALAVANEGKLGISRDAGKSAVWCDLPAGVRHTNWLSAESPQLLELYLGTDRGLYFSRDAAEHWSLVREGLPVASIGEGMRIAYGLLVTLEQGGIYYSPDGRGGWERIDRDAERSRITGLAETEPGQLLFGSESEGILQWRLAKRQE
jgi:photosystem II stability/assembly factor-like uncharacterized protein